jgi:hypothetical protein
MLNYRRIKLVYHHCGLAAAIEIAIKFVAIDILAILAYIGYCLTLPFQFFWMIWRGREKGWL